ncbi:flagellar motor protein MotB [Pseudomarimonas salicorniae]|uniref:Flagellar motor protein MotB n=1 Tax=Pseudomarimonas salicorniae TaxID=2933270 RepID=A0ABT0GGL3_9GAMM|nr:flagellar motor protein MotB [Lysobacter sp. CAU 1642]MCK7593578.1 flagellar motor protein MotB [Lysobacter sp. CAU 1642]
MAKKDQPVIIKKVKKASGHGGHHGGAWKIAYADFVTAMMAFFLLMWLLAVADKDVKRGIADYFNNPPVRLSLMGGQNVGEQTRPLPGGGQDLTMQEGARKRGDPKTDIDPVEAEKKAKQLEREELEKLKEQITAAIDQIPSLQQYKGQLLLDLTSEGLRIQVVDGENRPMFDTGRAQLKPYAAEILQEISQLINATDNRISISGHTDARAFVGGEAGYSNWELSNDRANAARRELIRGGLDAGRVMRVVGLADTVRLDKEDPESPQNRRISIVVMNKATEESITRGEGEAPPETEEPPAEADDGEVAPAGDIDGAGVDADPADAAADIGDAAGEPAEPAGPAAEPDEG